MASFTRRSFFISTLIFSTLFLSTTQIHARADSYFFQRFQRDKTQDNKNPNFEPVVDANQKTSSSAAAAAAVDVLPKKHQDQQDPSFVPESENGYGLYGHDTTYNNNNNGGGDQFKKPYEENVNYDPYNNERRYYNSNAYGTERSSYGNNDNNNDNVVEREGMSDTRFMEKGKYYFDVNDDKNHGELYKKHHYYRRNPSYAVSNYDRFGQDNNNGGRFYDNFNNEENSFKDPYNSRWEKDTMNEQKEQEQEEEFGEDQQPDQFVP